MSQRLGEKLVASGLINEEQLAFALGRQSLRGGLIGANLVLLYYLTEDQLLGFLAEDTGVKRVNLKEVKISKDTLKLIPLGLVEKYNIMPVAEKPPNDLYVACADPSNVEALDHLRFITGKKIIPLLTTFTELLDATIRLYYGVELVSSTSEKVTIPDQEKMVPQRIGEIMLRAGVITKIQLDRALLRQRRKGGILGRNLIKTGSISEQTLRVFLSEQMGIEEYDLTNIVVSPEIVQLVPQKVAEAYQMVPIELHGNRLTMACMDPTDLTAIDQIQFITGKEITPVLASSFSINCFIDQYYRAIPLVGDMPNAPIPSAKNRPALETYEAHESPLGTHPDEDPDLILFEGVKEDL